MSALSDASYPIFHAVLEILRGIVLIDVEMVGSYSAGICQIKCLLHLILRRSYIFWRYLEDHFGHFPASVCLAFRRLLTEYGPLEGRGLETVR